MKIIVVLEGPPNIMEKRMDTAPALFDFGYPSGYEYLPDWISPGEEDALLGNIESLSLRKYECMVC